MRPGPIACLRAAGDACPGRPDFVLPAYFHGRNLAESFYMGIPGLSWMNVVIGDPLMRLQ